MRLLILASCVRIPGPRILRQVGEPATITAAALAILMMALSTLAADQERSGVLAVEDEVGDVSAEFMGVPLDRASHDDLTGGAISVKGDELVVSFRVAGALPADRECDHLGRFPDHVGQYRTSHTRGCDRGRN
jgi:hypothetical protein